MNPWTLLGTSIGWILVGVLYIASAAAVTAGGVFLVVFGRLQLAELTARNTPPNPELPVILATRNQALLAAVDLGVAFPDEGMPDEWIVRVAPDPAVPGEESGR